MELSNSQEFSSLPDHNSQISTWNSWKSAKKAEFGSFSIRENSWRRKKNKKNKLSQASRAKNDPKKKSKNRGNKVGIFLPLCLSRIKKHSQPPELPWGTTPGNSLLEFRSLEVKKKNNPVFFLIFFFFGGKSERRKSHFSHWNEGEEGIYP